MSNETDIKIISTKITNMAFTNVGYCELRQFIINSITEIAVASYNKGSKDKQETITKIKEAQDRIIKNKFKKILNGYM